MYFYRDYAYFCFIKIHTEISTQKLKFIYSREPLYRGVAYPVHPGVPFCTNIAYNHTQLSEKLGRTKSKIIASPLFYI